MSPNVKVSSVERVPGGFRVCGTVDVDGAGNPIPAVPVCVVIRDSWIKRALLAVRDEAKRFAKKLAKWFGKKKGGAS